MRVRNLGVIEFGGFTLDPVERSLTSVDGERIQLTRRLYDTLLFMVERPGRLLEKQALLDAVWKGSVVEDNTLSRTISNLRKILGERGADRRYIETVSGLGYRFVEPVTVRDNGARPKQPAEEPSVAVLPFDDLSREADQGYFADGIAEEVLNRLTGLAGLRLIARSSSFRFRERDADAAEIGSRLGADYLLTGSVRKERERVRITAQLVETATGSQLWSERFDRELALENIFAVQDDIAHAVTQSLSATITTNNLPLQDHSTRDPEAYDLYLRGVAFMHQGGAHGAVRGAELLRAAVTRDPGFVRAWLSFAGMSRARLVFAPEHAARAVQDIEEACNKLLALAPQLWTAHLAQSWLLNMRRDWLGVEHALDKAAALAPGRPWELQLNRGIFYAQVHNVPAAIELFQAAARSNPLGLIDSGVLQMQLIIAGRHEEAEIEYRRSLDLAGDREMVEHLVLHRLWAQKKPFRQQFRRYLDLTQTKPAPVLEEVYTVADEPARALEKLRNAAAAAEYQNAPRQLVLAWWMANYGDAEAAFAGAWRAYVEMSYVHLAWLWFPVFACVRDHARFPDLLERVGLAEYQRAKNR